MRGSCWGQWAWSNGKDLAGQAGPPRSKDGSERLSGVASGLTEWPALGDSGEVEAGLTVGWAHLLGVQAPPQLPAASPTGALHQHRVHPEEARGREGGALPGADRHLQAERKWGVHGALAFSQLPDQGVQGRTAASAPPTATPAQAWRPGPQSSAASAAARS